ncbi:hypothetical protein JVU11DRAFT_3369 [Chiua virens]|nr:hypothetical protein JVU11DRAFT_3369 [Chiua virens]
MLTEKLQDAHETSSVTFEWTLKGLKSLFEASKGESKSKVTKSIKFGGGQWQILFYANSGTEGGCFVSLYLSCEPTTQEKENAIDGKWVREGVFKFSFELRSLGKAVLFNIKEAQNHSFSSKTANWGCLLGADHVYYHSTPVKDADAFLIVCTITSSPQTPVQPPATPTQVVPKSYLDCVGETGPKKSELYMPTGNYSSVPITFNPCFGSGFVEASTDVNMSHPHPDHDDGDTASDSTYLCRQFDDSDDEEDDLMSDFEDEPSFDGTIEADSPGAGVPGTESGSPVVEDRTVEQFEETANAGEPSVLTEGDESDSICLKLSSPSPRSKDVSLMTDSDWVPKKMRVVVNDVAYATYKAVLYYIYTDSIVFAPLSSSFTAAASSRKPTRITVTSAPSESQSSLHETSAPTENPTSRREWIRKWQQSRSGRPAPCSAKAVYRLADKLGLLELREKAFQHIQQSLTVENIPLEVFSPFSATFAEVRKVQVNYFLEHWGEIRASDAMRNVWRQIRIGRHPGFEEVWPSIALHLEFNPSALADVESPET